MCIHSGSCGGGHYYSYIKVKDGKSDERGAWLEFNDTNVREFKYSNLESECFGGENSNR